MVKLKRPPASGMKVARPSLVPGTPSEFSRPAFWEDFFRLRQRSFEWYGSYNDIQSVVHKYVKTTDRVLVAGCGNSEMSERMYDEGFKNITNIDNSQVVIDQMNERKGGRDMMHYYMMDLTKMEFYDNAFTVIIDKLTEKREENESNFEEEIGTLDAVMSDKSPANNATSDKIFSEYFRVLKNGGRYICITLGQDHILDNILEYFPNNGWLVRVHKVVTLESVDGLPVFAFVMTKFQNLPQKILEVCADGNFEATRVNDEDKIKDFVKSQQEYSMVLRHVRKEVNPHRSDPPIQLFSTNKDGGSSEFPRFIMHVVDKVSYKRNQLFAVFIIPKGSDTLRSFRTFEAKKRVAAQTPYQRVLFVTLHQEHRYGSQEEVQEELDSVVMDFAPPGVKFTDKVPYLSLSTDKMERRVSKVEGRSSISGRYTVEDFRNYLEPDMWYRQLIFKGSETHVASEIRLKNDAQSSKPEKSGMTVLLPDHSYLLPGHERTIMAGLFLKFKPEDKFRALMLGVGGGSMSSFILHNYKNCHVTALEIDPEIVEVAHTWFGLPRDKNQFQIHVTDAIEYVMKLSERLNSVENEEKEKYDVIVVDIGKNTRMGLACPLVEAVEIKYLESLLGILRQNGILIINVLCFDELMRAKIMYNIRRVFKIVLKAKCREFYNEILYCFPEKPSFKTQPSQSKYPKKNNKKQKNKKGRKNPAKIDQNDKIGENVDSLNAMTEKISLDQSNCCHDITQDSVKEQDESHGNQTQLNGKSGNRDNSNIIVNLDAYSISDERFKPPEAELPIRLDKYDSNWMVYWKERVSSWNKMSKDVDFRELINDAIVEREVNYYKSTVSS